MACRNEDSKSSSNSTGSPEHLKDDAGTTARPYYGCTFCKRGFTSAQALGGHMNIHRRDRAKNPKCQATPACHKAAESQTSHGSYLGSVYPFQQHMQAFPPVVFEALHPQYTPPAAAAREAWVQEIGQSWKLQEVNLELTLNSDYTSMEDDEDKVHGEEEGGDLDLELRLGH